jgi:hypothetical protein
MLRCCMLAALLTGGRAVSLGEELVPNGALDSGDARPAGWRLVGDGRWVDRNALEVTGSGEDSSYWRCDDVRFEPGQLYRFATRVRRVTGSGSAITGPTFANRDHQALAEQWKWVGHVFRVPDQPLDGYLRLGQWHATGAIQFDAVRLLPVVAVHTRHQAVLLGEGELIRDGEYVFLGTYSGEGSNYHRTLARATADFNSDRWVFGTGRHVTYRFDLPDCLLQTGSVQFHVNYFVRGSCVAEASRDGKNWLPVATRGGLGTASGELPAALLPSAVIWLRLRAADNPSYFQVNQVEFRARLSDSPNDAVGETMFADLTAIGDSSTPGPAQNKIEVRSATIQRDERSGRQVLRVSAISGMAEAVRARLTVQDGSEKRVGPAREWGPDEVVTLNVELPGDQAGERDVNVELLANARPQVGLSLKCSVPDFHRSDYGQRITGATGSAAVWWCDATHKIARRRPVPEAQATEARLEAARHDYEAVQIVVRPTAPLKGLTATASPLTGPEQTRIPAENINILQVYYHFVHRPTDKTGIRDHWPDALPPLDAPIDVRAGENQPLWVLVYVPPDAKPGDYRGQLLLSAEGFSAEVPLHLHVWDFALPARNHLETAYGLTVGDIFRYHQVRTEADKRAVLDMYFQSFAEHRISPYDPTPLDPIGVKFLPDEDPPSAELDFTRFDKAMQRAVDRYHFTGFRLPIRGMGGGTFHQRYPPKIGEFGEQSPEYQAMFSSYVGQLEAHLREKGWLDMAYVYWFDEPAPRDYDFVAAGMRRLKHNAPGLRRMLTEEPGDNVLAGLVDLWCPVSFHYDHEQAERRRACGEKFWWYVCTGPKAPYCTLFIDHPATELRVWHWQTWQRNVVGTLVWRANYWTSSAAFPDRPQDPYEDPMGYVSGYSTPRGVKRYWGNGDGRFIYPPLAAAVPGKSGPDPVLAPPVSSIRWEMIREGVEDYEYLYLLRDLIDKNRDRLSAEHIARYSALLEVPPDITQDMTTFTTDPTPIYVRRRAIAQAIETLSRSFPILG